MSSYLRVLPRCCCCVAKEEEEAAAEEEEAASYRGGSVYRGRESFEARWAESASAWASASFCWREGEGG